MNIQKLKAELDRELSMIKDFRGELNISPNSMLPVGHVSAAINLIKKDIEIYIDENWTPSQDYNLKEYAKDNNIDDIILEVGRSMLYHEVNHSITCPLEETKYENIRENVMNALKEKKKNIRHVDYVANAFGDIIVNSVCRLNHPPFKGSVIFFYDQGQVLSENKSSWLFYSRKYSPFYEAFVRLNMHLWGDSDDTKLVKKFYANPLIFWKRRKINKAVNKVISDIKCKNSILNDYVKTLTPEESWNELAYRFTLDIADLLEEELPEEQIPLIVILTSPTLKITYPSSGQVAAPDEVEIRCDKSGNMSGVDHVSIQLDGEIIDVNMDDVCTFKNVQIGEHTVRAWLVNIDGLPLPNPEAKDFVKFEVQDVTPPTLKITCPSGGQVVASDEVEIRCNKSGNMSGVTHVHVQLDGGEITNVKIDDDVFTFKNVQIGEHTVRAWLVDADGLALPNPEAEDFVNFDVKEKKSMEEVILEIYEKNEGIPGKIIYYDFDKRMFVFETLPDYFSAYNIIYRNLAKEISISVETDSTIPKSPKYKSIFVLDSPIKNGVKRFPDICFIIDTSGSMKCGSQYLCRSHSYKTPGWCDTCPSKDICGGYQDESDNALPTRCRGSTSFIPWGNKSKYHYALLGVYGVLKWLKSQGVAEKSKFISINFSSATISSGWQEYANIDTVRRNVLNPKFGETHLNKSILRSKLEGKEIMVILMLSDGEISNWPDIKNDFKKIISDHFFSFIQIGEDTSSTARDMENIGVKVFRVKGAEDLSELMIDLTKKSLDPYL
jgi:hypothetical protein